MNEELLLAFFKAESKVAFRKRDIFAEFGIEDPKMMSRCSALLENMVATDRLSKTQSGSYFYNEPVAPLRGLFEHVNPGFGFVRVEGQENDVFVSEDDMNGAIDGDIVELKTKSKGRGSKVEGRISRVIDRGRTELVGVFRSNGRYALVKPDAKRLYGEVFIAAAGINGAVTGDKVIVTIKAYASEFAEMQGEVKAILGKSGEHNTEMHAIMAEYGLPVGFEAEVDAEANAISEVITAEEIAKRRDFRKVPTITIDPADAKDFDDAISYLPLENGHVEVGVHIADVSHYIKPGTKLEEEAIRRATSVYLVDRCVPMLPEKLSNNLCSLRPHEEKLTFSAVFELDLDGNIHNEWYGRTVIYSDRRFSYEEAQTAIETRQGDYADELTTLNSIAKKLKKKRFEAGAVNFETVEVKFNLAPDGTPLGLYTKERKDAHKLIEEYMLLANRKVAEVVFKNAPALPMVFRVHDSPNPEKLKQFAGFALKFGHKVNVETGGMALSHSLNKLMDHIQGKAEQGILENLAVRSMAKAIYTIEPKGHFGLAFEHYSHFTSPIRRYPDVLTHRVLQAFLDKKYDLNRAEYQQRAKYSSEREKLAAEAERASIKYKQVEYMSLQKQHTIYEGIITGITDFGMFVEMEGTACEGMVRLQNLKDDYYEYDEKSLRLTGRRTGRTMTFGDKVRVKVVGTDIEKRTIDLELIIPPGKYGNTIVKQPSRGRR